MQQNRTSYRTEYNDSSFPGGGGGWIWFAFTIYFVYVTVQVSRRRKQCFNYLQKITKLQYINFGIKNVNIKPFLAKKCNIIMNNDEIKYI